MSHARLVVADDAALLARAAACRELIAAGEIDGDLGLSLVVWPSEQVAQASASVEVRRVGKGRWFFSDEREAAVEIVAGGLSAREVGERIGAHKQTVLGWVRASRSVGETGD